MFIIVFLLLVLLFAALGYMILTNYKIQTFLRRRRVKNLLIDSLVSELKGKYYPLGYFSSCHKVVLPGEYKGFTLHHKANFSECYNIIKFKTQFADLEIFFTLIKEGVKFVEVFNLRVFPRHYHIKSEGNVEKNYSRLNIFTNNKYLTEKLEEDSVNDYLKWLIRYNGDVLLISKNNLHFKAFTDPTRLSVSRVMDMIKAIHYIATEIYTKDNLEY